MNKVHYCIPYFVVCLYVVVLKVEGTCHSYIETEMLELSGSSQSIKEGWSLSMANSL